MKLPSTDRCSHLDQSGFLATAVHDLLKELLKEVRLLKAPMTVLGERGRDAESLDRRQLSPVNQRQAKCICSSSTNLPLAGARHGDSRSEGMRNRSSGSIEGLPVSLWESSTSHERNQKLMLPVNETKQEWLFQEPDLRCESSRTRDSEQECCPIIIRKPP